MVNIVFREDEHEDLLSPMERATRPFFGLPSPPSNIYTTLSPTQMEECGQNELHSLERAICLDLLRVRAVLNIAPSTAPPINRLPVELFVTIIESVKASSPGKQWKEMLAVCRYWFVVGATTPKFWSVITLRKSAHLPLLQRCLSRSLNRPLDITITCPDAEHLAGQRIDLLVPHTSRLSHLKLAIFNYPDLMSLVTLLRGSLPRLQALDITVDRSEDLNFRASMVACPIILDAEGLPTLASLTLKNKNIPIPTTLGKVLPNLLELQLYDTLNAFNTPENLELILNASPNLETLSFVELSCTSLDLVKLDRKVPPESRGKLKTVYMFGQPIALKYALSLIDLASTTDLSVHVGSSDNMEYGEPPSLRDILLPADRDTLPNLQRITSATLRVTDRENLLLGESSRPGGRKDRVPSWYRPRPTADEQRITLQALLPTPDDLDAPLNAADDFISLLSAAPIETLRVELNADALSNEEVPWGDVFAPLDHLRELSIVVWDVGEYACHSKPSLHAILDGLIGSPTPCPRLRTLRILGFCGDSDEEDFTEELVDCLVTRLDTLQTQEFALDELEV